MPTLDVYYNSIDGWVWEIRRGLAVLDAGTGYHREDAEQRGKRRMREICRENS